MMSELAPVVRILARLSNKWMGCGFLVPCPPGDANIHVMTCAHVVADALGDTKIQFDDKTPKAPLSIHFNGVDGAFRKAIPGRVVAWSPTPLDGALTQNRYDIAVIRLETAELPDGVAYPAFHTSASVDTLVMAHGPRSATDLSTTAQGFWTEGKVRGKSRPNQIEFLADEEIPEDKVIGGYSGGPLTIRPTLEVAGMVRSVVGINGRSAFALPIAILKTVWPYLNVAVRQSRVPKGRHTIFDLIDRTDQVLAVTKRLGEMLTSEGMVTGQPKLIFMVAGSPDEDHKRLGRRISLELGTYDLRGLEQQIVVSEVILRLRRGNTVEDSLNLMLEGLRQDVKASGIETKQLAYAMASQSKGWLVHLLLGEHISEEETNLLNLFLAKWIELSNIAACETYLGLSFGYNPEKSPGAEAAGVYRALKTHPAGPLDIVPLRSVTHDDLDDWPKDMVRHGYFDDEIAANRIALSVKRLLPDGASMSMGKLMDAIDVAGFDLDQLQNAYKERRS